jgi:hypothetical protein
VTTIAGAAINLSCGFDFGAPPITTYHWFIPETAFSNYVADSQTGTLYTIFAITNSNVAFYWVDGGTKRVTCEVEVGGRIKDAHTIFQALKPTGTITATNKGPISIGTNFAGTLYLQDGTFANPGIYFSSSLMVPTGFSCETEWVQLIDSSVRIQEDTAGEWMRLLATNALDTVYPGSLSDSDQDSPSKLLNYYQYASVSDSFTIWLLYKPTGGQWVPLRQMDWHWSATATLNGTNWSLINPSQPIPNSDYEATDYPKWTNNITDFSYQPFSHQ